MDLSNTNPVMADLEKFGITMRDLRFLGSTKEMMDTVPPMVMVRVTENFNINIDGTIYELEKGEVYSIQFNLFYTVMGFLSRDNKTHVFEKYEKNFSEIYRPYRGEDLSDKSLFVMATSIGDTLFMQPVIKFIKEKYPTCSVTYAASPVIRDLISCYPKGLIDRVYESTLFVRAGVIEESDYHLYSNFIISKNTEAHCKNAYDIFAEYAGVNFDAEDYPTELVPKKFASEEISKKLPKNDFVVCQVRASTSNRMIPTVKWRSIVSDVVGMGYDVVFLDTPNFHELYENDIINMLSESVRPHVKSLCKSVKGLKHTIAAMSMCSGVIGIDSSLVHIAGALGKPVVGIYTAFTGDVRITTFKHYDYVNSSGCECVFYPCYYHQDEISQGHCDYIRFGEFPDCVVKVDEKEVSRKFKALMDKYNAMN